jgi:hypothetical protein
MQSHNLLRSHIVKSGDQARQYRRNRKMLMKTNEQPHSITPRFIPPFNRNIPARRKLVMAPIPQQQAIPPQPIEQPGRPPPIETHRAPVQTQNPKMHTRFRRTINKLTWLRDYR